MVLGARMGHPTVGLKIRVLGPGVLMNVPSNSSGSTRRCSYLPCPILVPIYSKLANLPSLSLRLSCPFLV